LSDVLTDIKMARRIEEAESFAGQEFVRELVGRRPGADVSVADVAGGRAIFAGVGSPLSEAKAIGLNGPVTDSDFDRLEAVFFDRREPARVVVCPLADQSFIDGLGRRGYRLAGFENMLAMTLRPDDPEPVAVSGAEVRSVELNEHDLYIKVVAPNFCGPGESEDALLDMMATMFDVAHARHFLATIDSEPVGGGAVLINQGVALLAGAATLPPYRNRGVHAALHHARLAHARRSGCDLAVQGASPGSTSQRNAERRGFRVAYTRAVLIREAK
jgi:GNAT superfamily N-acetyltransferase